MGIPEERHTDNGPQFDSKQFKDFIIYCNIRQVTSSTGYPQSNGLLVRYVEIAKVLMEKIKADKIDTKLTMLTLRSTSF